MQEKICSWLKQSLLTLRKQGRLSREMTPQVVTTNTDVHGDYSSNVAMVLAKELGMLPHDLAQEIVDALAEIDMEQVEKVEIAGSGFINFYLQSGFANGVIHDIIEAQGSYGHGQLGKGLKESTKRVLIEYVSANPTGPLHVGHGRGAAYGEAIASLLEVGGYQVDREYYINDMGRQTDILAVSVWLRYLELGDTQISFPEKGYQGDYIRDIAAEIRNKYGNEFNCPATDLLEMVDGISDEEDKIDALIEGCKKLPAAAFTTAHDTALEIILDTIRSDMEKMGTCYKRWFSEKSLQKNDSIKQAIDVLKESGNTYLKDGALWFCSTQLSDDKDRVIQRRNGTYTYFASDIAYHWDKYKRGYDLIINVWGSDHHGYVQRLRSAIQALGLDVNKLVIILVQFANLYRGKEKLQMSTRSGEFITLKQLYEEVGNDAVHFFYGMHKPNQHMDFDIELAKSESTNNPVYYVQYTHARIHSVFRKMNKHGFTFVHSPSTLDQLQEPEELALVKLLLDYKIVMYRATEKLEPHLLLGLLRDISAQFHSYYGRCRILTDDEVIRNARLSLLKAMQLIIKDGLNVLGVSSPEKM